MVALVVYITLSVTVSYKIFKLSKFDSSMGKTVEEWGEANLMQKNGKHYNLE